MVHPQRKRFSASKHSLGQTVEVYACIYAYGCRCTLMHKHTKEIQRQIQKCKKEKEKIFALS